MPHAPQPLTGLGYFLTRPVLWAGPLAATAVALVASFVLALIIGWWQWPDASVQGFWANLGLGAWAIHMGIQWWELEQLGIDPTTWNGAMLGASGAVFGIMVAFAINFPNMEIRLLFPPIAMKAKYFVPIMAAAELFFGVGGVSTGIAHFAHLGGALTGFILIAYWTKFRFR